MSVCCVKTANKPTPTPFPRSFENKLELKNGTTFNINSDINILESWNDEGGTLTHNNYAVDFSNATGDENGVISINGATSFYDLKATGLGGKTLSFGEACNITVTNEMTLSGTDVENPLTVKGTKGGTINVAQNNIGNYLTLVSENLPTITNVNAGSEKLFEICLYSSSDSNEAAKEKNWLVFAGEMIFTWVGGSESDVDDVIVILCSLKYVVTTFRIITPQKKNKRNGIINSNNSDEKMTLGKRIKNWFKGKRSN